MELSTWRSYRADELFSQFKSLLYQGICMLMKLNTNTIYLCYIIKPRSVIVSYYLWYRAQTIHPIPITLHFGF